MKSVFGLRNCVRECPSGDKIYILFYIGKVLQITPRNQVRVCVGKRPPGSAYQQRAALQEALTAHIEVGDILFD